MKADKKQAVTLLSVFICVYLWLSGSGLAQTAPAGGGLGSLDDEKLMNELAARGMGGLLDRAFEVNNVPPAQRESRRALLALQELSGPARRSLPARQQQELVARVVKGIGAALPSMNDPEAMMQQARALIDAAADRHINTLELWGENSTAQAALRPVAEVVIALYDRAALKAGEAVERLGNQPQVDEKKLERTFQLQQLAAFNARMSDYLLAASLDAADPKRREVAERAIRALSELDTPDQPVRPAVRLRIAKLEMLRGNANAARRMLDSLIDDASFQPTPTPLDRYQARYFRAACELIDRRAAEAQEQLDALVAWSPENLPGDEQTRRLASAAAAMLQYRIHELRGALARTDAERRSANDDAVAVLSKLMKDRPDLQGVISELLVSRLPDTAPLQQLDPLLLQSLVRRGEEERLKPEPSQRDAKVMRRAVNAARELLARPGVDPALADNCRFVVPFLLQALDEQPAAGEAFLAYAEQAGPGERGDMALANAQAIVAGLRRDPAGEGASADLYERFLRVAVDRFDRREFAYEYARRLQLLDRPADAAKYFALVPADDRRALPARFFGMLAAKQQLDRLPPGDADERSRLLARIQKLADEVTKAAASPAASDDRRNLDSMLVRTKLLAAELARTEQRQPQRAIDLLADIESSLKRLEGGEALLPEVLLIRVQSYMALGQSQQATSALVQLLGQREGGQGAAIVYNLLEKLNQELDAARAAGDTGRIATVARNRAELSGFLVAWARDNPDPRIRQYTYRYMVFDAASKHLAADLEADPATQRSGREEALSLYRALETPEHFQLYTATLDASRPSAAAAAYDPAVSLGIALLCYDLEQFAESRDRLARLLNDRRLGPAVVSVETDGVVRETDNDQYWEAVLKFLRSNVALGQNLPQCQGYLREQYVRWGPRVGGRRWKADFEALRRELIPDFAPATAPATTQPQAP